MKRFVLLLAVMLMCLSTAKVSAAGNSGSLSGTTKTNCGDLLFSSFYLSGDDLDSVSGAISYDPNVLAFYKIDKTGYSSWDYTFDTSKSGTIKFSAAMSDSSSGEETVSSEKEIFLITFIAVIKTSTTAKITAKNCTASHVVTVTKEVEDQSVIVNQTEIDEATEKKNNGEEVEIPSPVYGTKTVEEASEETVKLDNATQTITISQVQSNDSFLREINVSNGTLSPQFNKNTNSYKLTVDENAHFEVKCVSEDPKASVTVSDETSNQIIINVMAEDGTSNTYVLTVVRQTNYDTDPSRPSGQNPSNPTVLPSDNTGTTMARFSTSEIMIAAAMAVVAIAGFVFGGSLIRKGAHNQ